MSTSPFAVTKEMVSDLDDKSLRDLLSKLLEAEAMELGVPATSIDVGGRQTAPDGGVDASIRWRKGPHPEGWLPRRDIFYQCKAEAFPPSKINDEMRPKGLVRPIFGELASAKGAYIIFSTDDVGTKAVEKRIAAMRAMISDVSSSQDIYLDFFGADRISRWVNTHQGITLWFLDRIGKPVRGWRPLSGWSTPGRKTQSYLVDDTARASIDDSQGDVRSAIAYMRATLSTPGGCVRLIGLSGMGKTRLAEALFDVQIAAGKELHPAHAIYADAGHDLATSPALLAEQLSLSNVRAVLVVDNCTAKTHRQLAGFAKRDDSRVSLLTIDYDAGNEQPEGTVIVRLEQNSDKLLGRLLTQRFPNLRNDARDRLVEFSGGNARIAMTVARNSGNGHDLALLEDEELIDRLFQSDRGYQEQGVRRAANAASLVGAFYVEEGDGQTVEHPILAQHAELSRDSFYRQISTLLDWGVAQQRGPQRAIMPPALADMLAAIEIRRSDPQTLVDRFGHAPPRLFRSFAGRVGRLHTEPKAVDLAERLMDRSGMLADLIALADDYARRAFTEIAPTAPETALAAIERAVQSSAFVEDSDWRERAIDTLAHIAYDKALFVRSLLTMLPLVLASKAANGGEQISDFFVQRFWPALAWTLATEIERFAVVDHLLIDKDEGMQSLAVETLDHMLDHWHITSSFMPEWGTMLRRTEWRPNGASYVKWIEGAFERLVSLTQRDESSATLARNVIASHLREHCESGISDYVITAIRQAAPEGYWDSGWHAASDAMHFTRNAQDPSWRADLAALERELRPKTLAECFEAFVLGEPWRHWHPSGRENHAVRDVALLAKAVGVRLIRSTESIFPYLDHAVRGEGQNSTLDFGEGLARATLDIETLWMMAKSAYLECEEGARDVGVLLGIVRGADIRSRGWADQKLDEIVHDPDLAPYLVYFHGRRKLGSEDIKRFVTAMQNGRITPDRLGSLMMGGATKPIPAADLAGLLNAMIVRDDGLFPALQILHMRLYGDRDDKINITTALVDIAESILTDTRVYMLDNNRLDFELKSLAKYVLDREGGQEAAEAICRSMRQAAQSKRHWSEYDFNDLTGLLLKRFPRVVLDEIVANKSGRQNRDLAAAFFGGLISNDVDGGPPKLEIDTETVLAWASEDPQLRNVMLAEYIPYCQNTQKDEVLDWTPIAKNLIETTPNPVSVLTKIASRFYSGVSSGPFHLRYKRRRPMVSSLLNHHDASVQLWARETLTSIDAEIARWEERDRLDRSRFE